MESAFHHAWFNALAPHHGIVGLSKWACYRIDPGQTKHVTISLDGYLAGPDPSQEHPLGAGGERLHVWAFPPDDAPPPTYVPPPVDTASSQSSSDPNLG